MIALALLLAIQVAADTPSLRDREAAERRHLIATGLSPAGADALIAQQRGVAARAKAAVDRAMKADRAVLAAGALRPVDVAAFQAALTEMDAATADLARLRSEVRIAQLRLLSPADRAVLLRQYADRPAGAPLPIAPPAPRPVPPPSPDRR